MESHDNEEPGTASDIHQGRRTEECLAEMRNRHRATGSVSNTILIVGRTGAGKSSLLEDLTGSEGHSDGSVASGKTIALNQVHEHSDGSTDAGTEKFQIEKAIIQSNEYFVIDTPGFDPENEQNAFTEIVRAVRAITPFSIVAGILYLTCINLPRFDNFDKKLLQFVHAVSGDAYLPRVTFVTTFWTASGKERGIFQSRLGLFREKWRTSTNSQGLFFYQHGREYNDAGEDTGTCLNWFETRQTISEQAKNMVSRRYGPSGTLAQHSCVPILLRELGDEVPLYATTAGTLLGMAQESSSAPQSQEEDSSDNNTPDSETNSASASDTGGNGSSLLNMLGNLFHGLIQNVNFEVSFGGQGHGPRNRGFPAFANQTFTPGGAFTGDPHSVVDLFKHIGKDSSPPGRKRAAREWNIGGVPFTREWNTALHQEAQWRHGVRF